MIWKIIASIEFVLLLIAGLIIYKKAQYDMKQKYIEHIIVDGKIHKDYDYKGFNSRKRHVITISHDYGSFTYINNDNLYNAYNDYENVEVTLIMEKNNMGDIIKVDNKPIVIKKKGN